MLQKRISGHYVSFWDTRGSDTVELLRRSVPSGRCALVFVYDVTDGDSLHEVKERISEFRACGLTNPIVLLGNKVDKKSEGDSNKQNLKEDYPQAFVVELSAKTHTDVKALFAGLLKNKAFMHQLDAYSPELDGAQIPRIAAILKQRTRAGCTGVLWSWLSQHLFQKDKSSVDHIRSPGSTPFSVDGTVLHHIAQPSDFCAVTLEHETEDPPPSPKSSVLLPEIPAEKPASVKHGLKSSLIARTTSDILVEGKFMQDISKPLVQTAEVHISQFLYAETVYVYIHQPSELIQMIEIVKRNFHRSQQSQLGICAIEILWYTIIDNSYFSALPVFKKTGVVFTSSLRQKYKNAEYMASVQKELLSENPSEWARRYVLSLFVYARCGSVAYRDTNSIRHGKLIDVAPRPEGVELYLSLDENTVRVVVCWTYCGDINYFGIYLDSAMQNVVPNLAGWSVYS